MGSADDGARREPPPPDGTPRDEVPRGDVSPREVSPSVGRELPALRPIEHPDHAELEHLVTGFGPSAPPAIHTATTAIGAVDQVSRVVVAFGAVAAVLIALAVLVSPWWWIAVAVWTGFGIATVAAMVSRARSRVKPATPVERGAIAPPGR